MTLYRNGVMSKNQYLAWLKSRGEIGTWDHTACRAADALVKREAMRNFRIYCNKHLPKEVRDWVWSVANAHFGSVDVDDMLTALKMYPDWIESNPG